jgi:hypothetical protein
VGHDPHLPSRVYLCDMPFWFWFVESIDFSFLVAEYRRASSTYLMLSFVYDAHTMLMPSAQMDRSVQGETS